jgi:hypothetical protein
LLTPGSFMVEQVTLTPDRRFIIYNANTGPDRHDLDRRHLLLSSYNEWRSQREFQFRFRWDIQLLAFRHHLNGRSATAADTSTNGSALPPTGNRADYGADAGSRCGPFRRLRSAAFTDFLIFRRRHGIRDAVDDNLDQFKAQLRSARNSSGLVHVGNAAANVSAARDDFHATLINRLIQDGGELLSDLTLLAVHTIDHPYDDF